MSKEIERKFLIDKFPEELTLIREALVLQSYISINPEVRLREWIEEGAIRNHFDYMLTIKSSGELTREEVQWGISAGMYFELLKNTHGAKPITKQFRLYQLSNNLRLEASIVDKGTENEFMYAEIEFDTEEEAKKFLPPSFLGREITFDSDYKMKNYWERTRNDKS